ncbi:MAG TPA: Sir2 family NAD-dependent protein deacetylase [Pedobacter sp.]|uniref:SIR2 family NAD-dependent protein deacylase n=1 Tax=Pedobacter sp. TaxID=1411316 RepID=UPI002BC28360|nr:Sir2 family NAD-dependent protein deacetylase [Pedobacter sp.]HMI02892.1 Sir2 family NAD-dependent protein deacetylase [Pedobacter sp.]
MKNIVVLTGAGISAESGLKTFRDSDGLWEGYNIEDVATPEAWQRNPKLVQQFYNERRKSVLEAEPNEGHTALARLQRNYNVQIITQNIDDLHERAGSKNVLHLHGIITRAQSDVDPDLTYPINGWELVTSDVCEYGKPLRPHVVWFGEAVPNMQRAVSCCARADIFAVIGTSLQVYPAAGLTQYVRTEALKYIVDVRIPYTGNIPFRKIEQPATIGVSLMIEELLAGL